jgi:hypothetical protein
MAHFSYHFSYTTSPLLLLVRAVQLRRSKCIVKRMFKTALNGCFIYTPGRSPTLSRTPQPSVISIGKQHGSCGPTGAGHGDTLDRQITPPPCGSLVQ